MSTDLYFVPEIDRPNGFAYPKSYIEFVSQKSNGAAMLNMPPWIFASDAIWAMDESKLVFGRELVPFGQAENLDMLAYFVASGDPNPAVWLANPWGNSTKTPAYREFENFDAWLKYANELSTEVLLESPFYRGRKFWFPDVS
jgi:hypothetical protein